jgi:hypothetical protein
MSELNEKQKAVESALNTVINGIKKANKAGVFELEESGALIQSLSVVTKELQEKIQGELQASEPKNDEGVKKIGKK